MHYVKLSGEVHHPANGHNPGPSDYTFTGQYSDSYIKLLWYGSRHYDPELGRFISPDTIVPNPGDSQDWNRYGYARNNPVRFTDPSGHRPCDLYCEDDIIDWRLAKQDSAWEGEWNVKEQEERTEQIETILDGTTKLGLGIFAPPVGLFYQAINDETVSGWDLAFALWPGAGIGDDIGRSITGKFGDDIIETGYSSFRQLKKALGKADDGMEWHHIVEQSQIAKSGFSPQQIHNIDNVLAVDKTVHRQISGFYSSNIGGPGTERVRDWLTGQSFDDQYKFGISVLKDFGVIP